MWAVARNWAIVFLTAAIISTMIPGDQTKRSNGNGNGNGSGVIGDRFHVVEQDRRYHRILTSSDDVSFYPTPLAYDFYRSKCPQTERIVRSTVAAAFAADPSVAPAILRLVFHDCFIQGCDASILLNAVDGNSSEKDAPPNQTIRGFDTIDDIKSKLEAACPATVSCADVIVLAARDAVVMAGGPFYPILTGRRDAVRPYFQKASTELPSPTESLGRTLFSFGVRGFNERETVSLLGAHSIGSVHCQIINERLHNFRGSGAPDPTLTPDFTRLLQQHCNGSTTPLPVAVVEDGDEVEGEPKVEMDDDRRSSTFFHTHYYRSLLKGQGLLHADQQLMAGDRTAAIVAAYASDDGSAFRRDFARAMIKLSSLGVLTGDQGQVRVNCSSLVVT